MDRLAGILFQMQALNPDRKALTIIAFAFQHALTDDRELELRDLIALRQIGIEVVFAVEARGEIDFGR